MTASPHRRARAHFPPLSMTGTQSLTLDPAATESSPAAPLCARCGEPAHPSQRLELPWLVRDAVKQVSDLDRGFLHTLIALSTRPGAMVRGYIGQERRRFTNPAKYLLVMVALVTMVRIQTGIAVHGGHSIARGYLDGSGAGGPSDSDVWVAGILESVYVNYFNLCMLLLIPPAVGWCALLFRRSRLNAAEHLVFLSYTFAQICLIGAFLMGLSWIGTTAGWMETTGRTPSYLGLAAQLVYLTWAAKRFYGYGWFATALRVPAGAFLAIATAILMTTPLLIVLGVLGAVR
jgi:hypothetical protein